MGKRTPQNSLEDVAEVKQREEIIADQRSIKRAIKAKGQRRDRRYENRLLRTTVDLLDEETDEFLECKLSPTHSEIE